MKSMNRIIHTKNQLKQYIAQHHKEFEVVAESTHKVQCLSFQDRAYILKTHMGGKYPLSPFWQMMKEVFASDFTAQRSNVDRLSDLLSRNPHIKTVSTVLVNEEEKYTVFEKMEGTSWEPDQFPDHEQVCYQLGQWIGFNHAQQWEACGMPSHPEITDVKERLLRHVAKRVEESKASGYRDHRLEELYQEACNAELKVSRYSLIMMDISANQFVFDEEHIAACVDLDAYVIGPQEWELAILKQCVPNLDAFYKGYLTYQELPETDAVEKLIGYIMQ